MKWEIRRREKRAEKEIGIMKKKVKKRQKSKALIEK